MTGITLWDKLTCVRRELALRERVYPILIAKGKLQAAKAERELELMAAIIEDYEKQTGA